MGTEWSIVTVRVEGLYEGHDLAKNSCINMSGRHRKMRLLSGPSHKKQPPSLENVSRLCARTTSGLAEHCKKTPKCLLMQ